MKDKSPVKKHLYNKTSIKKIITYPKISKKNMTQKFAQNVIQAITSKDAHRMVNCADTDQTAPLGCSFKEQSWGQGYKTFFMLNSAEHEI